MNKKKPITKNSEYDVTIDGWSVDGNGVAHIDGFAVFVPNTIVGEKWHIKIVKVSNTAIYGKTIYIIQTSEHRIMPECQHNGVCGGCHTAHMDYETELQFKLSMVNNMLARIGGLDYKIKEIIPSDKISHYRNKSICAVGNDNAVVKCGFYRRRSHQIIPSDNCMLQTEKSNFVNHVIVAWMNQNHVKAYDEETGKGTVRHIFTREACYSDDFVVCIVSARGFGDKTEGFVNEILHKCPFISGIILNINKSRGNTVLKGDFHILWGNATIHDSLNDIHFEIGPQAFYQVNPLQAEKLYRKVKEYCELDENSKVLDLYCGAGTIGLTLAKEAQSVLGIEIIEEAIINAQNNTRINEINNASYFCADASDLVMLLEKQNYIPDVIVVDPPRKGINNSVIESIFALLPKRIVYVSCNPSTLARDLNLLETHYSIRNGCAVDMFPRTSHVETVVQLSKGNISSQNVRVEFSLEDMDMSRFQQGATYEQIQEWVQDKYGFHVTHLNIAQVKREHGIIERENYNKPKSHDSRQPGCPEEKVKAIEEALKQFQMI